MLSLDSNRYLLAAVASMADVARLMYIATSDFRDPGRDPHRDIGSIPVFFMTVRPSNDVWRQKMFARLFGLKSISPRDLLPLIRDAKVTTFDVNSPQSWKKAHVPQARNIDPLTYDGSALPGDKSSSLVFYCSNFMCRKAPNAALRAKRLGYDNVAVMSAGISGWLAAGLPTETGE
jgi:rhodanese-related sulfurtransferase